MIVNQIALILLLFATRKHIVCFRLHVIDRRYTTCCSTEVHNRYTTIPHRATGTQQFHTGTQQSTGTQQFLICTQQVHNNSTQVHNRYITIPHADFEIFANSRFLLCQLIYVNNYVLLHATFTLQKKIYTITLGKLMCLTQCKKNIEHMPYI